MAGNTALGEPPKHRGNDGHDDRVVMTIAAVPAIILVRALGKAAFPGPYGPVELLFMAFIVFVGIVLLIATVIEVAAGFIIGLF